MSSSLSVTIAVLVSTNKHTNAQPSTLNALPPPNHLSHGNPLHSFISSRICQRFRLLKNLRYSVAILIIAPPCTILLLFFFSRHPSAGVFTTMPVTLSSRVQRGQLEQNGRGSKPYIWRQGLTGRRLPKSTVNSRNGYSAYRLGQGRSLVF